MIAFRCGSQESTGFSPNFLVFSREVSLPVELVIGLPPRSEPDICSYVRNTKQGFVDAFKIVADRLDGSSETKALL